MVQREGTNSLRFKDQVNHEEQIENHFPPTIWSWIVSCYCQVSDTSVLRTRILRILSFLPFSFIRSFFLFFWDSLSISLFSLPFFVFGVTIVTTCTLSDPKLLINNDWTPLHIIFFPLSSYRKETGSSSESFFFQIDLEGKLPFSSLSSSLSLPLFSSLLFPLLSLFSLFLFFSLSFSILFILSFSFHAIHFLDSCYTLFSKRVTEESGHYWLRSWGLISCSLLSISLETSL